MSAPNWRTLGEHVVMRRKGFTLIELLVVIAIVVILAGILYPVFAATRRAAYNAACLSNVKQVGLAVSMYTQDYDETFPVAINQVDFKAVSELWQQSKKASAPYLWTLVSPYVKNPGLWRCPGDIGFMVNGGQFKFLPSAYEATGSSYTYNTDLAWLHDPAVDIEKDPYDLAGSWAPLTVGAIQKPADTFVAAEPAGHWHNGIKGTSDTYHQNGVCVDGHAKSVTRGYAKDVWGRPRTDF